MVRRWSAVGFAVLLAATASAAPAGSAGEPSLEGTVRDAAGLPLSGVHVRLERGDGQGPQDMADQVTDERGRYRFERIRGGSWALRTWLPEVTMPQAEIQLAGGSNQRDLVFPLHEIHGRVTSTAGEPVAKAYVELSPGLVGPRRERWSDANGAFTYQVLDGWYWLRASSEDGRRGEVASPLRIHGGAQGVEIQLRHRTIRGKVTGLSTAEVAAASVDGCILSCDQFAMSKLEADGSFVLRNLAPGKWQLWVSVGAKRVDREVTLLAADDQKVVDFSFPPCYKISGHLRGPDGQPIPLSEVHVSLSQDDGSGYVSLVVGGDEKDTGSFWTLLPNGTYRFYGRGSGARWLFSRDPLVVAGRSRRGVQVILGADGTISGRLLHRPPGRVDVEASQGTESQVGQADDQGRYQITGLSPGAWAVVVGGCEGASTTVSGTATLSADQPRASVDLEFQPGPLTFSGRLSGYDPAARYHVKMRNGARVYTVDPVRGGEFHFSGLAPGTYQIEVKDDDQPYYPALWLYQGEIELTADRSIDLPLSFPPSSLP
jgi:hypothetical protein